MAKVEALCAFETFEKFGVTAELGWSRYVLRVEWISGGTGTSGEFSAHDAASYAR